MKKNIRPTISIFRKTLLFLFVVGIWILFYWYQDIKQSEKNTPIKPTTSEQIKPGTNTK